MRRCGMPDDVDDGLTDELAAEIQRDLEDGAEDETRAAADVRAGAAGHVELVLYDDDGGEPDVVATLTLRQAGELARALEAIAGPEPEAE